jgi:DNA-directed RNA polymerase I subunit RPA1
MQFEFATRNYQSLISRYNPTEAAGKVIEDVASDHMKKTSKAVARAPIGPRGFPVLSGLPDPTLSVFSPSTHIGSTSEAYAFKVNEYTSTNPQRLLKSKKKDRETWHEWERKNKNALIEMEDFKVLMAMRYMRSLADPGEAVGLLASQGVGEPSTQMTLNTFHFAGHGAANVTLGIPRLREIVMTASANIKTPTMKLEVRPEVTDEQLEHFCKEASRVTLSQVVEEVTVDERLSSKNEENGFSRDKLYTVNLSFYPRAEYEEEFRTDLEQILRSFSNSFIPIFDKEISKALKTANKGAKLSDVGKAQKGGSKDGKSVTETGDDLANGDGQGAVEDEIALPSTAEVDDIDGDADDARRAKQSQQVSSYDDDSDGEDEDDDTLGVPKDDAALEAAFADSDSEKGDKENEDEDSDVGSEDIDVKSEKLMKRQAKKEKKKREDRLAEVEDGAAKRSKFVEKMEFDKEEGAWAKLHLKVCYQ